MASTKLRLNPKPEINQNFVHDPIIVIFLAAKGILCSTFNAVSIDLIIPLRGLAD